MCQQTGGCPLVVLGGGGALLGCEGFAAAQAWPVHLVVATRRLRCWWWQHLPARTPLLGCLSSFGMPVGNTPSHAPPLYSAVSCTGCCGGTSSMRKAAYMHALLCVCCSLSHPACKLSHRGMCAGCAPCCCAGRRVMARSTPTWWSKSCGLSQQRWAAVQCVGGDARE